MPLILVLPREGQVDMRSKASMVYEFPGPLERDYLGKKKKSKLAWICKGSFYW